MSDKPKWMSDLSKIDAHITISQEDMGISKGIHEFDNIAHMVSEAQENGLLIEVIWSFAKELINGEKDITTAASAALYEWDI